jgi:hypothetical protein
MSQIHALRLQHLGPLKLGSNRSPAYIFLRNKDATAHFPADFLADRLTRYA